ncbi:hypothetical protein CC2G_012080 [Coprinopsis cinerea AmutBmut pab1-1]|nr:hypothetical protein CC2G_012080 [Coprinopsis cinerea AmutBmut pab1-1]
MLSLIRRAPATVRTTSRSLRVSVKECTGVRAFSDDAKAIKYQKSLAEAKAKLLDAGFDPTSFREQHIVWGDQDPFQHVNNVRYARFFESARIQWMMSLGEEWGGPEKAQDMIKGKGVSLILQALDIHFRRPVTYPDTLLFGYCPLPPKPGTEDSPRFQVVATGYSIEQQDFVVHSKESLVWYDYDNLRKCSPPKEAVDIVFRRANNIDLRELTRKHSKHA